MQTTFLSVCRSFYFLPNLATSRATSVSNHLDLLASFTSSFSLDLLFKKNSSAGRVAPCIRSRCFGPYTFGGVFTFSTLTWHQIHPIDACHPHTFIRHPVRRKACATLPSFLPFVFLPSSSCRFFSSNSRIVGTRFVSGFAFQFIPWMNLHKSHHLRVLRSLVTCLNCWPHLSLSLSRSVDASSRALSALTFHQIKPLLAESFSNLSKAHMNGIRFEPQNLNDKRNTIEFNFSLDFFKTLLIILIFSINFKPQRIVAVHGRFPAGVCRSTSKSKQLVFNSISGPICLACFFAAVHLHFVFIWISSCARCILKQASFIRDARMRASFPARRMQSVLNLDSSFFPVQHIRFLCRLGFDRWKPVCLSFFLDISCPPVLS